MTASVTSDRSARAETATGERNAALYETDFYAWTQEQAAALAKLSPAGLDLLNLIEEIESLGRAQINALGSRYYQLCVHLLKLAHQPQKASRSWMGTVSHQRFEIAQLLDDSPSLKARRESLFAKGYKNARRQASIETGLDVNVFPVIPRFTVDEAETDDWYPESGNG